MKFEKKDSKITINLKRGVKMRILPLAKKESLVLIASINFDIVFVFLKLNLVI